MTIARSFAQYMHDELNLGTLAEDIFIGVAPQGAPSSCWWIVSSGGTVIQKNDTGEKLKAYVLNVFYRDLDPEVVDQKIHDFEVAVNTANCNQLTDFDTVEMEVTTFPTDSDIDGEDRTLGVAQVTITTYL